MNTPILFIIFNRPETTKRVFETIRKIRPEKLFIAADGPRDNKIGEKDLCKETRNIISKIDWECEVKTLFREKNLGCGKAVSSAITWFFENVEEGIILEDDCLPTESFFNFCKIMLEKYKQDNKIGMITGTNYLLGYNNSNYSYYFSKHCYVWGWATWKRAWDLFDISIKEFPSDSLLQNYFDNSLSSNYYSEMFNNFKKIKIDTWDIQWSAVLIKNMMYSIVPINNQISNIGLTGTHTDKKIPLSINMPKKNININEIKNPPSISYDKRLDVISMKNIVYKVIGTSRIKILIKKIIGRNNIYLIKKIINYKT
jgi:hypothetical protein